MYPLLTVLLNEKSLVEWVDRKIEDEEQAITELEREVADARAGEDQDHLAHRSEQLASRQRTHAWYLWARPYIQKYTPADTFSTLCWIMGLMLCSVILKSVFAYWQVYLAGSVVQLCAFDLRNQFFRRTMRLDLSHFSDRGSHELIARFTSDVESLSSGMRALFGKVLIEPLKAASCLAFACWFNWRLTLLTLVLFPLAAALMGIIGRVMKRLSRRNLESMTRLYKILQESFQGIRVVKAFDMERYERQRFYRETKRYYFQAMKLTRIDAIGAPILELLGVTAVAIALLAGSYLVITGATHVWGIRLTWDPMEQSMLLTFYALIAGICDPLRKVFSVYGRVQRGLAAADRIFAFMDRTTRVEQLSRAPALVRHSSDIRFEHVTFGYDPQHKVFEDVSFDVKFGETIAIVGTTGCGKTSLINLIPRFHDPLSGSVLIDGTDIRTITTRSLRRQLGIVTQHTVLFDDTIARNIAYGNPDVPREAIIAAAEAAYAHRFIEALPQGYDTGIGEMGDRLSGGQRQRIALARAILRDPSILILDEATSSLDVESEALIHKALANFARGRTTFIVTHRLSTLDIADRIVVLAKGGVEAVGTHEQLLLKSPTYCRLHDVRARGA